MENKTKWVKLWVQKHRDSIMRLSKEEAGTILYNIIRYSLGEPLEEMTPVSEFVFEYIRQDIDSSVKIYENRVDNARENGKSGGRPSTKEKPKKEDRHKYGEYDNVLLSDEELQKLKDEHPKTYLRKIEELSGYMKSTGKGYKSHYATLRNWLRKDHKEGGEGDESGEKGKTFEFI